MRMRMQTAKEISLTRYETSTRPYGWKSTQPALRYERRRWVTWLGKCKLLLAYLVK